MKIKSEATYSTPRSTCAEQAEEFKMFLHEAVQKQRPIIIIITTSQTVQSIKDLLGNHDRWTYGGKMMMDDQKISQYNVSDGANIFTSPGLNGGG